MTTDYNPGKKYTWTNEDEIIISGRDFGLFLNAFRTILRTEQAATILLAERANEAIEAVMAEYVKKGVIKEVVEKEGKVLKMTKDED